MPIDLVESDDIVILLFLVPRKGDVLRVSREPRHRRLKALNLVRVRDEREKGAVADVDHLRTEVEFGRESETGFENEGVVRVESIQMVDLERLNPRAVGVAGASPQGTGEATRHRFGGLMEKL